MRGAYSTHEREIKSEYKFSVGNLDGKRLFGRPRRRWNIILKWILAEGVNWRHEIRVMRFSQWR